VLLGQTVAQQASFDLTDQLRTIAPSFNTQRFPIADGTSFIRPANLRNLPPDQTLVLVNGARRHKSALVNLQTEPFGTVNQGAQAVDFGLIPATAIKHIEVLRDGASAQYGSDAIAGVINVILHDEPEGASVTAQYGEYTEGDGESWRVGGNAGFRLGENGFFHVAGEFSSSDITSRGSPRPDAAAVAEAVGADLVPFNGLGQRWGDPDVETFRLFLNAEYPLNDATTVYGHASFADSDTVSGFFYRAPVGVPGVEPRATLFVDSNGDGQPDPVDQELVDSIVAQGLNPADYLTPDAGSPSGFVALNPIHTLFPGGYNPAFGAEISDFAVVLGARGEASPALLWDVSARFGENDVSYTLDSSINPGLGALSPLSFRPGDLKQTEIGLNADFRYRLDMGRLAVPLNLAFGAEYRDETYRISAGDPASFEFGPAGILFGVGSDGFQGDSPDAAGKFDRDSFALYIDVEADVTDRLTFGGAARGESYDDFGETFDWKLAARYQATDMLAVRGTLSTGFRAPTPGQINTLDVTTTSDAQGNLVPLGTFPVMSPAAIALGAITNPRAGGVVQHHRRARAHSCRESGADARLL
jgi:iron complex outermembrane recepter protein